MNAARDYKRIKEIVAVYSDKLNEISEDIFQQPPSIGGWSFSEVYFHIFDASLLALKTMEDCIKSNGEKKPTAFIVKIILFFGTLPPGKKFKAPKRLIERLKKPNKAEAQTLINEFLEQLEIDYKIIGKANSAIKTPHPRMGYLNAFQWFRFTGIHLDHHLKQVHRIEKSY